MNIPDDIKNRYDFGKLIDHLNLKSGVEIGVCEGDYSEFLLANSRLDKLYSIDPWCPDENKINAAFKKIDIYNNRQEARYKTTRDKLSKFGDRSVIIRKTSHESHQDFKDGSLDFIYLDGSHRFTGFSLDLIQWYPKLKEGGIFAGHDYCHHYRYEVITALNGFAVEHKQMFFITTGERVKPVFYPSWWWIKKNRKKKGYVALVKKYRPYYLQAQKLLCEKGINITLPYEYIND